MEDIYSQMTPEQLQQFLHLGSLGEQGQALQAQLEQAIALRKHQERPHYGWLGGALSGLGNAVDDISSRVQEKDLRAQQRDLLKQKEQDRASFAPILASLLRGKQDPAESTVMDVPSFSEGGGAYGQRPGPDADISDFVSFLRKQGGR